MSHLLVDLVRLTWILSVSLSAQFCLGWWEFCRSGWAAGQDSGTPKSKSAQPRSTSILATMYMVYVSEYALRVHEFQLPALPWIQHDVVRARRGLCRLLILHGGELDSQNSCFSNNRFSFSAPPPTKAAYALLGKSLSTNLHSRISLCSLLGCRPLRGLHLRVGRQLRRNPCHAQQTVEADVFASGEWVSSASDNITNIISQLKVKIHHCVRQFYTVRHVDIQYFVEGMVLWLHTDI